MIRTRRTNEELKASLWRALSSNWQTVSQVSKKARMDIRTSHRLIKDYLEKFRDHLERSEIYLPTKDYRINDKECYAIEVAERHERIIALRLVRTEEISGMYVIAVSQLNR